MPKQKTPKTTKTQQLAEAQARLNWITQRFTAPTLIIARHLVAVVWPEIDTDARFVEQVDPKPDWYVWCYAIADATGRPTAQQYGAQERNSENSVGLSSSYFNSERMTREKTIRAARLHLAQMLSNPVEGDDALEVMYDDGDRLEHRAWCDWQRRYHAWIMAGADAQTAHRNASEGRTPQPVTV